MSIIAYSDTQRIISPTRAQKNTRRGRQTNQFNIDLMPAARDPMTSYPVGRVSDDGMIHFPPVASPFVVRVRRRPPLIVMHQTLGLLNV